jgi:hypothetical protein
MQTRGSGLTIAVETVTTSLVLILRAILEADGGFVVWGPDVDLGRRLGEPQPCRIWGLQLADPNQCPRVAKSSVLPNINPDK